MNIGTDILTIKSARGILSAKMIFSIASFIFSLVLFFMFILPGYRNMKILIMEEGLRSANLDKKNQTLSRMKSFERKMDNVSDSEIDKIKMLIPPDDKIEFQLSNLDILGKVMKVELYDLGISKGNNVSKSGKKNSAGLTKLQGAELKKVDYEFNIKGSYADILMFINSIERNIPMLKISKIAVRVEEKKAKNKEEIENTNMENKTIIASVLISSYNY